jgi:glutamate synthase (NADPH) large chain
VGLELRTPLLLGGCLDRRVCGSALAELAAEFGTQTMDAVLSFFTGQGRDPGRVAILDATFDPGADLAAQALAQVCLEAAADGLEAVAPVLLLVLDDSRSFSDGRVYLDPWSGPGRDRQ